MADIVVSGNSSGSVTLRAPDVSGTTILTLPTTTGTLVVTGGAQTVQFAAGSAAAPSITFTGDTNTGIFSPGADSIGFAEGGAEIARFDSSGTFIVGPFGGNGNAVVAGSSSPSFTNQPGTNLLLKSGDGSGTGSSFMSFSTSPAGSSGTTVNTAVERMRIDSSGILLIGRTTAVNLGGGAGIQAYPAGYLYATVSNDAPAGFSRRDSNGALILLRRDTTTVGTVDVNTAGVTYTGTNGVQFTATQSASSDANTLDDYEEGTFTPSFLSTGASFTYDSAYRVGRYTKIGNLVTFSLWCATDGSAPTGTTSNTLLISGLPFTAGNSSEANAFALTIGELYNVVWTASKQQATAFVGKNTSEIRLYWEQSNVTSAPWTASNIKGATYLLVSGSYQV